MVQLRAWWLVLVASVGLGSARLPVPAEDLAWSADGRYLAATGAGEAVRIDLRGRARRVRVDGIGAVRLSPDGAVALGVRDDQLVSVDLQTRELRATSVPEDQGRPVLWARGSAGDLLVTRTVNHFTVRRSAGDPKDPDAAPTRNFRQAWLDPADPVVYLDTGYGLELRHLGHGLTLRTFDAGTPDQRVQGAVRDEDGRVVVLLTDAQGVRLWTPPEPPGSAWAGLDPELPIALSGDGRLVAVGEADRITLYRAHDRGQHAVLPQEAPVTRLAASPDGAHLAAALQDGRVQVLAISSDGVRSPVRRPAAPVDPGAVRSGSLEHAPLVRREASRRWSLSGATSHLGFTPGGSLVGQVGGRLVEVDPETGEERPLDLPGVRPGPHAWSPDGAQLAAVTDRGVGVFDPVRRRLLRTLATDADPLELGWRGAALVLHAGGGQARAWDPKRGQPLGEPFRTSDEAVSRLELSPDGGRLAVTGRTPRVVDAASGAEQKALDAQWGGVLAAAWSPDGRRLATAGGDGTVLVWDTAEWRPTALLEGAIGRELVFSPDGERLVSAGWDGAVVADVGAGGIVELLAFDGLLASADWGPVGIAIADQTGNVYLWEAPPVPVPVPAPVPPNPGDADDPAPHAWNGEGSG